MNYKNKYLKYKIKYLNLKLGGSVETTNNYVNFVQIENPDIKKNLKNQFMEELIQLAQYDAVSKNLIDILNKYKFTVKIFQNPSEKYYLIIISSHIDRILIEVGHKYGFPRGFPLIWYPGKQLNMYGFYPKFENDKMKEDELDRKKLDNAIEINFNFKYSGFLGQVIAFTIDGENYWTTCGKNSTNYKYSDIVCDLIKDKMTPELLAILCQNNLHVCGETISKYDQHHGAAVGNQGLVTTLIAKGHWINIQNKEIYGAVDRFIKPYDQNDMHQFCMENNLLIDAIYKVKSYEGLLNYMIELNNNRNTILLPKFNSHWNEFSNNHPGLCEIKYGNINHNDYLGTILEGLIIKITKNDGSTETIKYKFPFYTSRTMLLRDFLSENDKLNPLFFEKIFSFVNRWVVNYKNQKNFWRYILAKFYDDFPEFDSAYKIYEQNYSDAANSFIKEYELKDKEKSDKEKPNKQTIIHKHIFTMDLFLQKPYTIYNEETNYLLELENILDKYQINKALYDFNDEIQYNSNSKEDKLNNIVPIIISLGPIGSGKTTISTLIERNNPLKFKHIDGDILDLGMDDVMNLKSERAYYSIFKIVEAIIENKIPVISTGGGILLGNYGQLPIIDYLNIIFSNSVTFIPYILLPTNGNIQILENNLLQNYISNIATSDLRDTYYDENRFKNTYNQRQYASKNVKFDELFNHNKKNFNVVVNLLSDLKQNNLKSIILFPLVNSENFGNQNLDTIFNYVNTFEITNSIIPQFTQKRLLINYILNPPEKTFHHITIDYKKTNSIKYTTENNYPINKDIDGKFYICISYDFINNLKILYENTNYIINNSSLQNDFPESINKIELINILVKMKDIINVFLQNYNQINDNIKVLQGGIGKTFIKLSNILKSGELKNRLDSMKDTINFNYFKNYKLISFIIFPELFEGELGMRAHITVNPGSHKPELMKHAAQTIYTYKGGDKIIELESEKYYFDPNPATVRCHIYNVFYI